VADARHRMLTQLLPWCHAAVGTSSSGSGSSSSSSSPTSPVSSEGRSSGGGGGGSGSSGGSSGGASAGGCSDSWDVTLSDHHLHVKQSLCDYCRLGLRFQVLKTTHVY
jgi:hypothetical protein